MSGWFFGLTTSTDVHLTVEVQVSSHQLLGLSPVVSSSNGLTTATELVTELTSQVEFTHDVISSVMLTQLPHWCAVFDLDDFRSKVGGFKSFSQVYGIFEVLVGQKLWKLSHEEPTGLLKGLPPDVSESTRQRFFRSTNTSFGAVVSPSLLRRHLVTWLDYADICRVDWGQQVGDPEPVIYRSFRELVSRYPFYTFLFALMSQLATQLNSQSKVRMVLWFD